MKKKRTTEQFIKLAKEVHKNYFDYSKTIYECDRKKIEIGCPVHGFWFQRPSSHLRGAGCGRCTNMQRYGAEHPSHVEIFKAKRRMTFKRKYGGHPSYDPDVINKNKHTWSKKTQEEIAVIQEKKRQTFLKKYGYDNPFNDETTKQAIWRLRTERGEWTDISNRYDFYAYSRRVRSLTEKNYRKTALSKRNSNLHLDHVFSVKDGFQQNVLPEIIAHPANLRIIEQHKNHSKSGKSEISLDDLLKLIEHYSI